MGKPQTSRSSSTWPEACMQLTSPRSATEARPLRKREEAWSGRRSPKSHKLPRAQAPKRHFKQHARCKLVPTSLRPHLVFDDSAQLPRSPGKLLPTSVQRQSMAKLIWCTPRTDAGVFILSTQLHKRRAVCRLWLMMSCHADAGRNHLRPGTQTLPDNASKRNLGLASDSAAFINCLKSVCTTGTMKSILSWHKRKKAGKSSAKVPTATTGHCTQLLSLASICGNPIA